MSTGRPETAAADAATVAEQLAALDIVEALIARSQHLHPSYVTIRVGVNWLRQHIEQRERHRALGEAAVARWLGLGMVDHVALGAALIAAIADIGGILTLPGDEHIGALDKGTPAHD